MASVIKGTSFFIIAQTVFLASGYVIHAGLGRMLGPKEYGIFGVILYLLTQTQIFLRTSIQRAASKYIAEEESKKEAIKKLTFRYQIILSAIIFITYIIDFFVDLLLRLLQKKKVGVCHILNMNIRSFLITPKYCNSTFIDSVISKNIHC